MNLSAIQLLTSRARWAKFILLVREQGMMGWFSVRRVANSLLGKPARSRAEEALIPKGDVLSTDKAPAGAVCSEVHKWQYTSKLSMPADVLSGASIQYRQDKVLPDGSLSAEYDYHSAVFHEAYFYSNGASHVSAFDRHGQRLPLYSSIKFEKWVPQNCKLEPNRYLFGKSLSLYGNVENASGNIGHWIVDGLARLLLALQHHSLDDIQHVLVPRLKYDFQRDSLHSLGIPEEKIIELDALHCVRCEHLLLTTAPRGYNSGSIPGWLIDGYRDRLLPVTQDSRAGKRIYISRRDAGSRKFVDEEAIITCLEGYGFEPIEMSNYSFDEKIALFAHAEMIVGLTGAGLTNVMFCKSDAVVVELFPESYVTYFYASMCNFLGVNYHPLVFPNVSLISNVNPYYGDLHLDPRLLADKLEAFGLQGG